MVAAAAYRENINEYDDDDDENTMNIYSSPPVAPLYLDTNILNDNMNGQINIDFHGFYAIKCDTTSGKN